MEITKESWYAVVAGQVRDAERIQELQQRLNRMAQQVERLSYMVEFAADWIGDEVGTGREPDPLLTLQHFAGLEMDGRKNLARRT